MAKNNHPNKGIGSFLSAFPYNENLFSPQTRANEIKKERVLSLYDEENTDLHCGGLSEGYGEKEALVEYFGDYGFRVTNNPNTSPYDNTQFDELVS